MSKRIKIAFLVLAAVVFVGGIFLVANLPNPTLVDDTPLQTNRQLRYESQDECETKTQSICIYSNNDWYSETYTIILQALKEKEEKKVTEFLELNINNYVQAEPVLGAPKFFVDEVEFYNDNKLIATFEDGHILGYMLGTYSTEGSNVQIHYLAETFNNEGESSLDDLKLQYGFTRSIDTSSWQVYRSDEFRFELKYPEDWITELSGPNYVQEQIESGETISGTVAPTLETISFFSPAWQAHPRLQFNVTISETTKEVSVENYDSLSYSSKCDPRWLQNRPEHIQIITNEHGIEFLEVKVIDPIKTGEPEKHFSCYYSKSPDGREMAFEMASREGRLDFENAEKQLQKTLSTFRFVDSVDISGWQTYRSEEFGFEVKYPAYLGEIKPYTFSDKVLTSDVSSESETEIQQLGIIVVTDEPSIENYIEELRNSLVCYDEFDTMCFNPVTVLKESNITVGTYQVVQQEIAEHALSNTAPTHYSIETFFDLTPRMIVHVTIMSLDKNITESLRQLNNQILATFRFVE